ncbi:hypothetical protein [Streptomyces sp. NBC_00354]|uniref:hypothetical protein n=1 Tax=Streptomyces sp. NBC_00354 TaxID=2975723 RepID=UPI002E276DAB
MPDRTNEITAFTALLDPFDLTGTVVTADALHTQREHAKWLVEVVLQRPWWSLGAA